MPTTQLAIPWTWTKYNLEDGSSVSQSGTETQTLIDNISGKTKRPPGNWRAPTSYSRNIEQGDRTRVYLVLNASTYNLSKKKWVENATYTGGFRNPNGTGIYVAMPAYPSALTNRVVTQALLRLKDQQVNLAQAFGERRKTADLFSSNITRIAKAVMAARKLNFPAAIKALGARSKRISSRDAANGWLELQYGWMPLLSDIHGATDELLGKDRNNPNRYALHVRAHGSQTDFERLSESTYCALGSNYRFRYDRNREVTHQCMVRLDYFLSNPLVGTMAELGLTNPLSVAWELVPFSFVVDWAVPYGSFFSALDATKGFTFRGGSRSQVTRVKTNHAARFTGSSSPSLDFAGYAYIVPGKSSQVQFSRSVYSSSPTPRPPRISEEIMGIRRAANALALLRQAFR